MRHILPISLGVGVVLVAYACGGQPAPPPAPVINQDSIDAAQAQTDSLARVAEVRDSINRERQQIRVEEDRQRQQELARAREEANRVRAAVATRVNFDFDRSDVRQVDAATMDQKLAILQANPSLRIQVAGHCDERGSDEYNLALGNRRALAAKRYLTDRGIAEDRITTTSMGEERPLAMGNDEDAWAQNRRDEFTILGNPGDLRMPQGI